MSNIIDKIQLSGVTYDIGGQGGSGVSVVEVTQAQYDALPTSAKTDTSKIYVITDAEAGDLTNYYTKTETNSAITQATSGKADTSYVDQSVSGKVDTTTFNTYSGSVETALSGKQDTLVSGTNIKTINNESILGSGNINIQGGGGGGKAIEAGTNISVTTGATADTINCTLQIKSGSSSSALIFGDMYNSRATATNSVAFGNATTAETLYGFACGSHTKVTSQCAFAEGNYTVGNGYFSHAEGNYTSAMTSCSHAEGSYTKTSNDSEHASGQYNVSNKANNTWGNSGNTLFSVGNGTADNARHNAFEVRQNGDIYLTLDGQDVKLQDHLGGGGGGGKAIEAGRGISVTTGATADTVSFNLPIYDKNNYSISECHQINSNVPINSGNYNHLEHPHGSIGSQSNSCHKEGLNTKIGTNSSSSHVEGFYSEIKDNSPYSHAEGYKTSASGQYTHTEGYYTKTTNEREHASGSYNVSNKANTTFGDSGNTLFSIGNGTANDARHNAFEIRQNGDIYVPNTDDTSVTGDYAYSLYPMVRLQDTITATAANTTALGGLSLVKLTQAEYDALATKDSNTLYVIVN